MNQWPNAGTFARCSADGVFTSRCLCLSYLPRGPSFRRHGLATVEIDHCTPHATTVQPRLRRNVRLPASGRTPSSLYQSLRIKLEVKRMVSPELLGSSSSLSSQCEPSVLPPPSRPLWHQPSPSTRSGISCVLIAVILQKILIVPPIYHSTPLRGIARVCSLTRI